MGRPDSWLWPYDRSINPGLRFPFELMCRFGWQVTGPGGYWLDHSILSSIQSSAIDAVIYSEWQLCRDAVPTLP